MEGESGSSGCIKYPKGYWKKLRELCDRHGILLIADEVMSGFGRSGEWFAIDAEPVTPDLITFAKGVNSGYVPLGGVIVLLVEVMALFAIGVVRTVPRLEKELAKASRTAPLPDSSMAGVCDSAASNGFTVTCSRSGSRNHRLRPSATSSCAACIAATNDNFADRIVLTGASATDTSDSDASTRQAVAWPKASTVTPAVSANSDAV